MIRDNFDEIWGESVDTLWPEGRNTIKQIVTYLKDKSFVATYDGHGGITLHLPFPVVLDKATGESVSILTTVPSPLLDIWWENYQKILDTRKEYLQRIIDSAIGSFYNDKLIARIDHELTDIERNIISLGGLSLAETAAIVLGVHTWYMFSR